MLGWSINLFRVFGIQLAIHVSFLLLLAYFGWEGWQQGSAAGVVWYLALVILFFGCVVLHELGHSLTARRFGVIVPRILLMPIGGMAEFDRIPRSPRAELLISAAGPLVNFVLVAALLPLVWREAFSDSPVPVFGIKSLLIDLTWANLVMGTFNLLPVFPMDGGRILRALMARKMDYMKATRRALLIAKIAAPVLAFAAAFFLEWYLLSVLFVFIFFAGDAEYRALQRRERDALYWADWSRRMAAAHAAAAGLNRPETSTPPPPYLHGPN